VDLHQGQAGGIPAVVVHLGVDGLHQGTLAGAARTPQQGVVGGQSVGEAPGVLVQGLGLATNALQKRDVDPIYMVNRVQPVALGVPDEGVGSVHGDRRRRGRGESLQSLGNALENRVEVVTIGAVHLCSKERTLTG
jgi:hypothetical protein